jgi:hypothetical protein
LKMHLERRRIESAGDNRFKRQLFIKVGQICLNIAWCGGSKMRVSVARFCA